MRVTSAAPTKTALSYAIMLQAARSSILTGTHFKPLSRMRFNYKY